MRAASATSTVWAISRTVGFPIGPLADGPEAVDVLDVHAKLDELGAVVLIALALRRLAGRRRSLITPLQIRIAATLAGPLFLRRVLAAFGGGHEQPQCRGATFVEPATWTHRRCL